MNKSLAMFTIVTTGTIITMMVKKDGIELVDNTSILVLQKILMKQKKNKEIIQTHGNGTHAMTLFLKTNISMSCRNQYLALRVQEKNRTN